MITRIKNKCLLLFIFFIGSVQISAQASINVIDDDGNVFKFPRPMSRIVSLAPHITELLFAAGASAQIVGTVSFSDYPEAAKIIPLVGSYNKIDIEAVLSRNPDLVIAWSGGNSKEQLEKLKLLGIEVYISEPKNFTGVAENIRNMGKILATENIANLASETFLNELDLLKQQYPENKKVNVFYQVWNDPLMTISDGHLIGQVIKFCSGNNVFGELPVISPRVSIEAVIKENPDVIVAGMAEGRENWLKQWEKWQVLNAVKNKHVYSINADYVTRQTPRVILGIRKMCEHLEKVRNFSEK